MESGKFYTAQMEGLEDENAGPDEPTSTQEAFEELNNEFNLTPLENIYRYMENYQGSLTASQGSEQGVKTMNSATDRLPLGESQQQNSQDRCIHSIQLQAQAHNTKSNISSLELIIDENNLENIIIRATTHLEQSVISFPYPRRLVERVLNEVGEIVKNSLPTEPQPSVDVHAEDSAEGSATILGQSTRDPDFRTMSCGMPRQASIRHRSSAARRRKTPEQLAILETSFDKKAFPDRKEREKISAATGLDDEKVRLWFQHRRNRDTRRKARCLALAAARTKREKEEEEQDEDDEN